MNSTLTKLVCACVLTLSVCAGSLRAEPIQYIEPRRSVLVSVGVHESGQPNTEDSAFDGDIGLGIFDSSVAADVVLPLAFGHGDATQFSELASDRITAFGTTNTVITAEQGGGGEAAAFSALVVTFILNEPSGFTLDGLISFFSVNPGLANDGTSVELLGESVGIVFSETLSTDGVVGISDGGMLQPDTYTLQASTVVQATGGGLHAARGSFDFDLVVPEPATALLLAIGVIPIIAPRRR